MWTQLIIASIFVIILIYFVVVMAYEFVTTSGTLWCRLLAAGKGSATKLWAGIVSIGASAIGVLASSAEVLNMPQVEAALREYAKPEWFAAISLVIMLITIWARRRTMPRSK